MCRGKEEQPSQGGFRRPETHMEVVSAHAMVVCELCKSPASLYCLADDAFLCRKCDKWVHGANFLAQRHIRCFLCSTCQGLTDGYLIGASSELLLPTMVSRGEGSRRCDSDVETGCSRTVKMPFLFL